MNIYCIKTTQNIIGQENPIRQMKWKYYTCLISDSGKWAKMTCLWVAEVSPPLGLQVYFKAKLESICSEVFSINLMRLLSWKNTQHNHSLIFNMFVEVYDGIDKGAFWEQKKTRCCWIIPPNSKRQCLSHQMLKTMVHIVLQLTDMYKLLTFLNKSMYKYSISVSFVRLGSLYLFL